MTRRAAVALVAAAAGLCLAAIPSAIASADPNNGNTGNGSSAGGVLPIGPVGPINVLPAGTSCSPGAVIVILGRNYECPPIAAPAVPVAPVIPVVPVMPAPTVLPVAPAPTTVTGGPVVTH